MKRKNYSDSLHGTLESIGRYDLTDDFAERPRPVTHYKKGPSEWATIEPSDFGPEHDYLIVPLMGERWAIYCVSKAALEWCYDKLPEDIDRYSDRGFIVEDRYMDFIEGCMQEAGLMSLDEYTDAMEEMNSKMREWE